MKPAQSTAFQAGSGITPGTLLTGIAGVVLVLDFFSVRGLGRRGLCFLVSPNRVAAFLPLTGDEDAGHDDEGLAAGLGDASAESWGHGVPEILLYLVGEVTLLLDIMMPEGVGAYAK